MNTMQIACWVQREHRPFMCLPFGSPAITVKSLPRRHEIEPASISPFCNLMDNSVRNEGELEGTSNNTAHQPMGNVSTIRNPARIDPRRTC
jgi:hypothetical protein